jgi:hypothetical protein
MAAVSKGTILGNHTANNAIFAGLPSGINIWLDIEVHGIVIDVDIAKTDWLGGQA